MTTATSDLLNRPCVSERLAKVAHSRFVQSDLRAACLDGMRIVLAEMGWRSFETAPRDGTWFLAYRPAPEVGTQTRVVTARWHADYDDFIFPADVFDIYDGDPDERSSGGWLRHDFYEGGGTFTHWMPLPNPPTAEANHA